MIIIRFFLLAVALIGSMLILNEIGVLQRLDDYSWETSRFTVAKDQALQIELPVEMHYLDGSDEGYIVSQAEGDHIFVDLHSENLHLSDDRKKYMQEEPHKRIYKIIDKYKVQNVELTSQKSELVNHIPLRRFHFVGQLDGYDVEVEVAALSRRNVGWFFTFLYDTGDLEAERQVQKAIESLKYVKKS